MNVSDFNSSLVASVRSKILLEKQAIFTQEQNCLVDIIDGRDYVHVVQYVSRRVDKNAGVCRNNEEHALNVLQLKMYYFVCQFDRGHSHAILAEIDDYWHGDFFDTAKYDVFAEETGHKIHHRPLYHKDKAEVARIRSAYAHTSDMYEYWFGTALPEISDRQLRCGDQGKSLPPLVAVA